MITKNFIKIIFPFLLLTISTSSFAVLEFYDKRQICYEDRPGTDDGDTNDICIQVDLIYTASGPMQCIPAGPANEADCNAVNGFWSHGGVEEITLILKPIAAGAMDNLRLELNPIGLAAGGAYYLHDANEGKLINFGDPIYSSTSDFFYNCNKTSLINTTSDSALDRCLPNVKGLTLAGHGFNVAPIKVESVIQLKNLSTGQTINANTPDATIWETGQDLGLPKERVYWFDAFITGNSAQLTGYSPSTNGGAGGEHDLTLCDPRLNGNTVSQECGEAFNDFFRNDLDRSTLGPNAIKNNGFTTPTFDIIKSDGEENHPSGGKKPKFGGSNGKWSMAASASVRHGSFTAGEIAAYFSENKTYGGNSYNSHGGMRGHRKICELIDCSIFPGGGAVSNNSCNTLGGSGACCMADADCGSGEVCMVDSLDVNANTAGQSGQCVGNGDNNYNSWYCADQACADERNGCSGVTFVAISNFDGGVSCQNQIGGGNGGVINGGACSDGSECNSGYCDFSGPSGVCANAPAQASAFNYCENSKCIAIADGSVLSAYTDQYSCVSAGAYCKRNSDNVSLPAFTSEYDCEDNNGQCLDVNNQDTGASSQYQCEKDRCVDVNNNVTSASDQSTCELPRVCQLSDNSVRTGLCQLYIWDEAQCNSPNIWTNYTCYSTATEANCSDYWQTDSYTINNACSVVHQGATAENVDIGNTWVTNTGADELTWVIPNTWVLVNNWHFPACSGKDSGGNEQYCVNENYGSPTTNSLSTSFNYCTFQNGIRVAWMYSSSQGYTTSVSSGTDCSQITHLCKNGNNQFYLQSGSLIGVSDASDCPGSFSTAHPITHDGNAPTQGIEPKICQSTDGQNMSPCDFSHAINDCGLNTCVGDRNLGGICSDLATGSPCHDDGFLSWSADPGCSQPGDTCTYGSGGAGSEKICN